VHTLYVICNTVAIKEATGNEHSTIKAQCILKVPAVACISSVIVILEHLRQRCRRYNALRAADLEYSSHEPSEGKCVVQLRVCQAG
jgi:hypothetical protein